LQYIPDFWGIKVLVRIDLLSIYPTLWLWFDMILGMHVTLIALVFGVIFIGELPDKSLFASLVLGSKFPSWYVWLGAASAFLVHVTIAVTAGHLLTLLPHKILEIIITLLFLGGSMLLFFGGHDKDKKEDVPEKVSNKQPPTFWKIYATSFGVVFLGEWGDITQIATANYAAKYHDPLSVGIGALLALWTVTALAVTVGSKALTLVPPRVLQNVTGSIMLLFAIFTAISIFR
jgi:putative Ca2+/H+ antiporter (TMEM165/GDT1 family)